MAAPVAVPLSAPEPLLLMGVPSGTPAAEPPAAWADLPVDAAHRPIVLLAGAASIPRDDQNAGMALAQGRFELTASTPAAPPAEVSVDLVTGRRTVPTRGLVEAVAAWRATLHPESNPSVGLPPPRPVTLDAIRWGRAPFATDRGVQMLPAWLLTGPQVRSPLALLGVADPAVRTVEITGLPGGGVLLAPDDRTLTTELPTSGPPPCGTGQVPRLAVRETSTTVALGMTLEPGPATFRPTPDRSPACPLSLQATRVTARLAAPLGGRLLLIGGRPVMAAPSGRSPSMASAALQRWSVLGTDPATRPLIPVGQVLPAPAWRTETAQRALDWRRLSLEGVPVPEIAATLPVTTPAGRRTEPNRRFAEALRAWHSSAPGTPPADAPSLQITQIRLGESTFRTDRGPATIPTWQLTGPDLTAPLLFPAVADATFATPVVANYPLPMTVDWMHANASPDGRRLTISVDGHPPCTGTPPKGTVIESDTAAAVTSAPVCGDGSSGRGATISLTRPLGGRLLVDALGRPVPVT